MDRGGHPATSGHRPVSCEHVAPAMSPSLSPRPGEGPSARATGLSALSPRERRVAELVAERRSNREIAEVLRLRPKTVETHLRSVFVKLRVASRADVARLVQQGAGEQG